MLELRCHGTPYEIGRQHGSAAKDQVRGSIAFYQEFFMTTSKLAWPEVCEVAERFVPFLMDSYPAYIEEMQGLAEGANVDFTSILALNVRTEIAYGMVSDGCTAFCWKTNDASFLAQNWDWNYDQSPNIVEMHISQHGKPNICQMTEAGILGKIGLNSAGLGVTLNAIQAKGVDHSRLPTHLALRTALECTSRQEACDKLMRSGVSAACHITIADSSTGGVGLECSAFDTVALNMDCDGICAHSNHFIRPHLAESKIQLPDSPLRLERVNTLLKDSGSKPTMEKLQGILKDKHNYPGAICRGSSEKIAVETLFSIVMDLDRKYAIVKMGQPTEDDPWRTRWYKEIAHLPEDSLQVLFEDVDS